MASKILKIIVVAKLPVPVRDMGECDEIMQEVSSKFQHRKRYELELHSLDGQEIAHTIINNGPRQVLGRLNASINNGPRQVEGRLNASSMASKIVKIIVVADLTVPVYIWECSPILEDVRSKFQHLERYELELNSVDRQLIAQTIHTNAPRQAS